MPGISDPKVREFVAAKISSGELVPRTAHNYAFDVERFGRFLKEKRLVPFEAVYAANESDIRSFLSDLRTNNTINSLKRKLAGLESFYGYLVRIGDRKDNPASTIVLPKAPRRAKELYALSREEVRRLLQAPLDSDVRKRLGLRGDFAVRDHAMLHFFYSGPKRHEITTTRATDFDPTKQVVRVRNRVVPLSKEAAGAIAAYLAVRPPSKSRALFLSRNDEALSVRQAWFILKQYMKAAGVRPDADVETLRRSYAVHALEDGVYVLDVLTALGNVSMTALHDYAKIARYGFLRRQKTNDQTASEIPFSRFLQSIHDIRVTVTNLVLGTTNDVDAAECAIRTQIAKLMTDWPSLVDEDAFVQLQLHARSGELRDLQRLLAEDLSALETRALALFSENQQRRQEAGFIALLHPRVIQSSLRHYLDKDYRDAVLNSMLALTETIRDKSGVDGDGTALASRIFKPESPVLTLSGLQTRSDRDEQAGFHKMILGAYEAIRNPNSHEFSRNVTEQEAAQCLVFVSYLIAGVESATLSTVASGTAV